jgi:hypothetical protein
MGLESHSVGCVVDTKSSDESLKILGVLTTRTPASRGLQVPQKAHKVQLIITIIIPIITIVILCRLPATMEHCDTTSFEGNKASTT